MLENYSKTVLIEANTMVEMAKTDILPAIEAYTLDVAKTAEAKKALDAYLVCGYETKLVQKLSALTDRIAERDGVCVLVFSAQMEPMISAEATPGCVIHHISLRDLWRMAEALGDSTDVHITTFTMIGFRNDVYDAGKFAGRVPPSDDGTGHSMVTAQRLSLIHI